MRTNGIFNWNIAHDVSASEKKARRVWILTATMGFADIFAGLRFQAAVPQGK
jgi:hypothetical protein